MFKAPSFGRLRVASGFTIGALSLACAAVALASGPPYGIPSGVLQNDRYKYQSYGELYEGSRPSHPNPETVTAAPDTHYLHITHAGVKHKADDPNIAVLMAHVPVDASVWFDGEPTTQTGKVRWFTTTSLTPGLHYSYSVRVVWFESGKWVNQTQKAVFQAGDVLCVDLMPAGDKSMANEIMANLEKLSPADRKLAERQKLCAVQNKKQLGEMGVPMKVMVKGQPVFLCCDGCEKTARSHPEQTLAKVEELRTINKAPATK